VQLEGACPNPVPEYDAPKRFSHPLWTTVRPTKSETWVIIVERNHGMYVFILPRKIRREGVDIEWYLVPFLVRGRSDAGQVERIGILDQDAAESNHARKIGSIEHPHGRCCRQEKSGGSTTGKVS